MQGSRSKLGFLLLLLALLVFSEALRLKPSEFTPKLNQKDSTKRLLQGASLLASQLLLPSQCLAGTPIPVEISSSDLIEKATRLAERVPIVPDTSIQSLDGAENLGALLFTIVLYQGLGITKRRPAEIVMPFVVKVFNQEDAQWYKDYQEGFAFSVPPVTEAARVAVFGVFGWYTNIAWVAALDGDAFWGWSTAACLTLPALLFNASRVKPPTRAEAEFQEKLNKDFEVFAQRRLTRSYGEKCSETSMIISFRRMFANYRSEEDVSDKVILKAVRQWVGYKPDSDGVYLRLSMTLKKKEAKIALQKNLQRAAELKEQMLLATVDDEDSDDDNDDLFDNEFVRK